MATSENEKSDLQKIPGVGANMEKYLQNIGIRCIADLVGQNPEELYHKDCLKRDFRKTDAYCMCIGVPCIMQRTRNMSRKS